MKLQSSSLGHFNMSIKAFLRNPFACFFPSHVPEIGNITEDDAPVEFSCFGIVSHRRNDISQLGKRSRLRSDESVTCSNSESCQVGCPDRKESSKSCKLKNQKKRKSKNIPNSHLNQSNFCDLSFDTIYADTDDFKGGLKPQTQENIPSSREHVVGITQPLRQDRTTFTNAESLCSKPSSRQLKPRCRRAPEKVQSIADSENKENIPLNSPRLESHKEFCGVGELPLNSTKRQYKSSVARVDISKSVTAYTLSTVSSSSNASNVDNRTASSPLHPMDETFLSISINSEASSISSQKSADSLSKFFKNSVTPGKGLYHSKSMLSPRACGMRITSSAVKERGESLQHCITTCNETVMGSVASRTTKTTNLPLSNASTITSSLSTFPQAKNTVLADSLVNDDIFERASQGSSIPAGRTRALAAKFETRSNATSNTSTAIDSDQGEKAPPVLLERLLLDARNHQNAHKSGVRRSAYEAGQGSNISSSTSMQPPRRGLKRLSPSVVKATKSNSGKALECDENSFALNDFVSCDESDSSMIL